MGLCSSCFGNDNEDQIVDNTPDPEVRRRQQLEAVEKRLQNQENRGIKNPEKVRRMQQKAEEREKIQQEAAMKYDGTGPSLRWQMN